MRYELSRCMACGCCMEACPNYGPQSDVHRRGADLAGAPVEPAPVGRDARRRARSRRCMETGGVDGCGNAQNCVQVCPKDIPLTTSIADMNGPDHQVRAVARSSAAASSSADASAHRRAAPRRQPLVGADARCRSTPFMESMPVGGADRRAADAHRGSAAAAAARSRAATRRAPTARDAERALAERDGSAADALADRRRGCVPS